MSLSESRLRKIEARIAARSAAPIPGTLPVPPRFRWLKRLVLLAVLYSMFLGVVRTWWEIEARRRFDAAVAKYRALGQPVLVEDFKRPPIPDEQNGGPLLERAIALLASLPIDDDWLRYAACDLRATSAHADRLRPMLTSASAALDLAQQGLAHPIVQWGPELKRPVIDVLFPELSGARKLSRLLSVQALLYVADGEPRSALDAVAQVLQTADAVRSYTPSTIAQLVATAIDSVASSTVQEIAPDLVITDELAGGAASREQVRALIAMLLDDRECHRAAARAMCYERLFQIDVALSLFDGSASLAALSAISAPPRSESVESRLLGPMFLFDGVKMMDWSAGLISAAQADNWPAVRAVPAAPAGLRPVTSLGGLSRVLSAILLPSLHRALELHHRSVAYRRMAAISLAMRLFEVDHGRRPESLDVLVPAYLPFMPRDPFTPDGQPFGYVPDGPWLYSVNSDGVDNGGMYGLTRTGSVDLNSLDLVFFLTRDYPRSASAPPENAEAMPSEPRGTEDEAEQPQNAPGERSNDQTVPESQPSSLSAMRNHAAEIGEHRRPAESGEHRRPAGAK